MKTGLVTFFHIHHYGAALQACATQRAVETLGSECELLHYYVNQNNDLFRKPTGLGTAVADAHTALHYGLLKTRYDRFEDFSARFLHVAERRYTSLEELRNDGPQYDVCLSGSDQIWNPTIFPDKHFDPVFFGAFTGARKIAYAPSFGIPHVPDSMEEELRDYLTQFSHISVREKQGQRIVREITGQEVPVVLDPTLLLKKEEWAGMAADPGQKGYILCYCISRPGALIPYVERLSIETGLPVVQLCGTRRKVHPKARCILDAGPAEFLGLFRNASYVCTNSFHGTVFSVQFEKPFFTAVAPGELAAPEFSRTYSLLSTLGLTRRIVGKGDTAELLDDVDWNDVERRLEAERGKSLRYLSAALSGRIYDPAAEAEPVMEQEDEAPKLAPRMDCTGCTACASGCPRNAITMVRDSEGFAYPKIQETLCVRCGHCTAVCPALSVRKPGPVPAVYAAWNKDDAIRRDSTSGGLFSLLAEDTLESGGVVFGAALDAQMHLRHIACFQKEDLRHLRGAKYVQSDLGGTYREIRELLKNRPVLFSGTPCQVDGLYHFLGVRPENLTTCDLVCHGVPSPGVWEDYVSDVQSRKKKTIQNVRFRNKVVGWKDSQFTVLYRDGSVDSSPLFNTEYGRAFGRALFLRPSCYRCRYTSMTRAGDLTLGDFWGLQPDELSDQQEKGVSLLLVNTPHGSHVFDRLPIGRKAFAPERAVAGNPRLASPTAFCADRAPFFAAYALEPFCEVRKRYFRMPPLPARVIGQMLTPEMKAKIRRRLG